MCNMNVRLPLLPGAQVERAISGVQSARSAAQRATYWYNAVPYRGVSYVHRTLRRGLQWGAWLRPGAESKPPPPPPPPVEGGGEIPSALALAPAPICSPEPSASRYCQSAARTTHERRTVRLRRESAAD